MTTSRNLKVHRISSFQLTADALQCSTKCRAVDTVASEKWQSLIMFLMLVDLLKSSGAFSDFSIIPGIKKVIL